LRALLLFLLLACTEETAEEEEPLGTEESPLPLEAGQLEILQPMNGSRIEGNIVLAEGTAAHLLGLQSHDQQIPLNEDGSWTARLELPSGLRLVEFRGESLRGTTLKEERLVLLGEGRMPEAPIPEGLVFFLSKSGMGSLAETIAAQVDPQAVESEIKKSGNLYRKSIGLIGPLQASVKVKLSSLDFRAVEATLLPQNDEIALEIELKQLEVHTRIEIRIGPVLSIAKARITSDPAVIRCRVIPRLSEGQLRIGIRDSEVDLQGFELKLTGIPKGVEPESIRRDLRRSIEAELAQRLKTELPGRVNPVLAELDQELQIDLGHERVRVQVEPSRLQIDENGAELSLSQTIQGPSSGDLSVLALSTVPPAPIPGSSATLSLADDLPNRVLHEAWQRGLFNVNLSTVGGELDERVTEALDAREIRILARPRLPPVIVGRPEGVQLQVGPIVANVESPDGAFGTRMELEISAWVDLEAVLQDGVIRLQMTDLETRIILLDHDWSLPAPLIILAIRSSMELEDRIDQALERISIPMPVFPGMILEPLSIDRAPDQGYTRGGLQLRQSE